MMMEKCEECNGTGRRNLNLPGIPDSSTAPESLERADWRGVLALVDNHPFPVRPANHADPMDPEEVLRRAEAFAPTPKPNREGIMRLALEMIVDYDTRTEPVTEWYKGYTSGLNQARKIAEQALRECGK
jgi:hypothetical protein